MPQRRTAEKELRKSLKRKKSNLTVKANIKKAIKEFKKAIEKKDTESAKKSLSTVYKTLDKAAKKKTIHSNKAARKKSRLTKLLKKVS